MALSIMGLDDSSQPGIQSQMTSVITCEDQQMRCISPPSNFVLEERERRSCTKVKRTNPKGECSLLNILRLMTYDLFSPINNVNLAQNSNSLQDLVLLTKQLYSDCLWVSLCLCILCHLAYYCLHDSIKSTLRGISVSGHFLLLHFLCEALYLLRQRQYVTIAELWWAGFRKPTAVRTQQGDRNH